MDELIAYCKTLDARQVAERLKIPKARERHKWACPTCGSSDALHIYAGANRGAYCWSCESAFDAIALVEAVTGRSFKAAVKWLADEFGFSQVDGEDGEQYKERIQEKIEKRRAEQRRKRRERRRKARPIFDRLHRSLGLGPAGRDYVESRGLPWQWARKMGVRSVGTDRVWRQRRVRFWPDELEIAGLQGEGEDGTYPVPWRTPFLVFDYRRKDGSIDMLRFRHLDGVGDPKYLSPLQHNPAGPYLKHSYQYADQYSTLYVCEGELDALSVIYTDNPAVASPGNGVWSAAWSKPFRWFQRVVVLCDGDEAGRRFSQKVRNATAEALGHDWVNQKMTRRVFSDGVDANDALQDGTLEDVLHAA